jgi:hypothetical protein
MSRLSILTILFVTISGSLSGQIPVEIFAGDKKAGIDILFFKYFKNKKGHASPFLFFNRNRATLDYKMTSTTNLPQFGFTEAISFNKPEWHGFAPVVVAQVLNRGIYPKAGIQFAKVKKDYTIFTWLVSEMNNRPNLDWFLLARYQPPINSSLHLFSQIELVNAFPLHQSNNYSFIQRLRLGLKIAEFQFGIGADFTATGRDRYSTLQNTGGFIRYEF